jgi:hypothetical protein
MRNDPRKLKDGYFHIFEGDLGRWNEVIKNYDLEISYQLEKRGDYYKVRFGYSKQMDSINLSFSEESNFIIQDAPNMTLDKFLEALQEGIKDSLDNSPRP